VTDEQILEWADLIDCIDAKTIAEADALFNSSELIRAIVACKGDRTQRLDILRQRTSRMRAMDETQLKRALRKICERTSDPVARSIAGEALEIADQESNAPLEIMPRGGVEYNWQEWSLIYRRRMRALARLICREGYAVNYDGDGMPCRLEKTATT
jgi:hypothetical protein